MMKQSNVTVRCDLCPTGFYDTTGLADTDTPGLVVLPLHAHPDALQRHARSTGAHVVVHARSGIMVADAGYIDRTDQAGRIVARGRDVALRVLRQLGALADWTAAADDPALHRPDLVAAMIALIGEAAADPTGLLQ